MTDVSVARIFPLSSRPPSLSPPTSLVSCERLLGDGAGGYRSSRQSYMAPTAAVCGRKERRERENATAGASLIPLSVMRRHNAASRNRRTTEGRKYGRVGRPPGQAHLPKHSLTSLDVYMPSHASSSSFFCIDEGGVGVRTHPAGLPLLGHRNVRQPMDEEED
jgi:hypothetical protein